MQSEEILKKILDSTYTLSDIYKRTRILKKYLTAKFFERNEIKDEEVISNMNWLSELGPEFYSQFNVQNISQIFTDLEKRIETLNPLSIYLPFQPSKDEITTIGIWLRKNTKTVSIFDVKSDRDLIGGCALVLSGRYRDYSLRAKLQENIKEVSSIIRSSLVNK